ncbi:NAD-dependent epimerase/dehydratase family protein [Niallia sp. 03133]|uniref:NAD-dependent epimerase/dehydratase family protein n=1 Tax=Niallia sp. 03133 TaxID=3458060 RepID=UPI004044825B
MKKKPSILITGANGFTGQHACEYFIKAGYEVIAATRQKTEFPIDGRTEYCDLTNRAEIMELLNKTTPNYLLHLAGKNNVAYSWVDPIKTLEVNAMSTAYLIEAVHQIHPACKILVVSSALQFDPLKSIPPHPYSLSKTLQSIIAKAWGDLYEMDIMIATPSNLIGPGYSNGVCSILAKKIIAMEDNKTKKHLEVNNLVATRDFIDVRDVVRAYDLILQKGKAGESYEITSGKCHSLEQIISLFKPFTHADFTIHSLSIDSKDRQKEVKPIKIQQLGWEQTISLSTSLKDILQFYRSKKEAI